MQKLPRHCPSHVKDWLLHAGSFIQRLQDFGVIYPKIRVLAEGWQFPSCDERVALNLKLREYAWVREVLIYSDEKQWMRARTVIPRKTLTGKQKCLLYLKSRSLGSILFRQPDVWRSPFVFAEHAWLRRSTFYWQQKSLLLTEVFLPDIETL